jgi:hypothetical protein
MEIIKNKMTPSYGILGKITGGFRAVSTVGTDRNAKDYMTRNQFRIFDQRNINPMTQNYTMEKFDTDVFFGVIDDFKDDLLYYEYSKRPKSKFFYAFNDENHAGRFEHTMLTKANYYKFTEK